jgi:uncharacterized protein (TIGR03437 family)
MLPKSWMLAITGALALAGAALAGSFGLVVPIGGSAADVALDEGRGVLYVANFTANRIEVVSLKTNRVQTSINVAAQPGSISLSPDGRWLLVAHFGNNASPASPTNGLTLIDLTNNNAKQAFALGNPPLGVAFGYDKKALVVTTQEYILFDPVLGTTQVLNTVANVTANTLPVKAATAPTSITASSIAVSADYLHAFGIGSATTTFTFRYDVATHTVSPGGIVLASGIFGPRVVSLNQDGSVGQAGWVMVDSAGNFINLFPQVSNQFGVGTSVFDNKRGLMYAHMPTATGDAPVLQILDSDNLTVRERLNLPENTTGKSVLTRDASVMYSVSDSGVLVLPIGNLNAAPRLTASAESLVFRGNFCDRKTASQSLFITDPGGGRTPFSIRPSAPGISVSPSSGVTPAQVTVTVDPNVFSSQKGTSVVNLTLNSAAAVNVPPPVRVLVNVQEPDQRGTFIDIPGVLVDVLADPARNRYYVLRQDKNVVLVYDSTNNTQIGSMRTYNVPTSMAMTLDNRYLLVGHTKSHTIGVFDLETLQPQPYISSEADNGNVVRSIAVSTNRILASSVDFQGKGHILSIDPVLRNSTQLATLGVYENTVDPDTVVATSANASKVMAASADGTVWLYDANVDSFTVSRQDVKSLGGPYAASAFDMFVVGNYLLDSSLVPMAQFESATGSSSGFAFIDLGGIRTTAPNASSAGIIQQVDLASASGIRPTRMVEAPLLTTTLGPEKPSVFTRTLAPLTNRNFLVALTTSGITVLPWNYDASVAPPKISGIASAADGKSPVAPGGLVSIFGSQLSPVNMASSEIPIPTALGNSCLTVNGQPTPIIFVSSSQINAQMPRQAIGNVIMTVHTPGGVSDNFNLTVVPNAPAIFLSGQAGAATSLPTVVRDENNLLVTDSNPVHRRDTLVIYLTGLGTTSPSVGDGMPAPSDPLAQALTTPVVALGDVTLPVLYAGLAPGQVGVYQINATVPNNAPQGLGIPLTITQGGWTQTVNVRVIQ